MNKKVSNSIILKYKRANNNTVKFAKYVKVFLNPFKISLFFLDTVKLGTKDIWETWTDAHPKWFINKIKFH